MRVIASVVVGLAAALSSTVAAAAIYTFDATETSALSPSPVAFNFSVDTASAFVNGVATSFNDVTISKNGVPSMGNTVNATYTTSLASPLFYLIDTDTRPFYSGIGAAIRFHQGSFAVADGATDGEGTLTISGTSAVPEPAAWGFMIIGIATVGVRVRNTRYRQAQA